MDEILDVLVLAVVGVLAFGAVGLALTGVRGTCSQACDREGRPLCSVCPRRERAGGRETR